MYFAHVTWPWYANVCIRMEQRKLPRPSNHSMETKNGDHWKFKGNNSKLCWGILHMCHDHDTPMHTATSGGRRPSTLQGPGIYRGFHPGKEEDPSSCQVSSSSCPPLYSGLRLIEWELSPQNSFQLSSLSLGPVWRKRLIRNLQNICYYENTPT